MNEGFSPIGEIDTSEFDWLFELVIAVLFMSFGIFATVTMIRTLDAKTQIEPRLDKVELSYDAMQSNNPFILSGYDAWMMAYLIDPTSDVSLTLAQHAPEYKDKDRDLDSSTDCLAMMDPYHHRDNFVTYRNTKLAEDFTYALSCLPYEGTEDRYSDRDIDKLRDEIYRAQGYYYELEYVNTHNTTVEGTHNKWVLQLKQR